MKRLGKKDVVIALTTGSTATFASLYAISQTQKEEPKDEPSIEPAPAASGTEDELREELGNKHEENQSLLKKNSELSQKVEELQSELNQADATRASLTGLREELKAAKDEIDELKDIITSMADRESVGQIAKDELEDSLGFNTSAISYLIDEIDRLESEYTSIIDDLTDGNDELVTKVNELQTKLAETTKLYQDMSGEYLNASRQIVGYEKTVLDLLKDRTQFQKWQRLNPVELKPGCWLAPVKQSTDPQSYALNCPQEWITNGGKNVTATFSVFADKDKNKELYEIFKGLFTKHGQTVVQKPAPRPPR